MNDSQKWLQAAAGIEQDLAYLSAALTQRDIENLRIALAVYRKNAAAGIPFPSPDDLFCIERVAAAQQGVQTEMRRSFRTAC